jgi:hypothetical protein
MANYCVSAGYQQGTGNPESTGIPCTDTLPKNTCFHWETLCKGYLRVTILYKKRKSRNRVGRQPVHWSIAKVFEMVPLDTLMPC